MQLPMPAFGSHQHHALERQLLPGHRAADPLVSLTRLLFKSRDSARRQECRCKAATEEAKGGGSRKRFKASNGREHLGSTLRPHSTKAFPGPPPGEGPPLRVLPIGGLGEIGMNCMLIGVYDRYVLVDAGLMFPDFQDLGMAKILPDVSFLSQWRDKIEAVIITHGHEDHIGAFPWVFPALDPSTQIYAGGFAMQLIKRRLQEYSMWDESRFHTFKMRERFQLGPFDCEPIRVTHSIPDCCGMILRSDHGNIVHTGDWKIDETPIDGETVDREFFEAVSREGIALMMSDSTNVLSPGRTTSEASVQQSIIERVLSHEGRGRVISTQFASNLHRLASMKKAADIAGRKICFIGMSLTSYLEAADANGRAPFNPKDLVPQSEIDTIDPNKLLIVTTGSQAEPRAALNLASREASPLLKLLPSDLVMYAARVIPGNDPRVMQMMNRVSALGPEIAMGRSENLHTSGHAYQEELRELIQLVKPQHFLPVHGEYAFLTAHAQLARDTGIRHTSVIRNGQMLGVSDRRNGNAHGSVQGMQLLGEAKLRLFYNDGNKGTGTREEMALDDRATLSTDGLVVAAVDIERTRPSRAGTSGAHNGDSEAEGWLDDGWMAMRLRGRVRITTRALWVDQGRLLEQLHKSATLAIQRLPNDSHLVAVERIVADAIRRECRSYNRKKPEVIVIANEADPRVAAEVDAACRAAEEAGTYVRGHMQNGSPTQERSRRQGRGGRTSQVQRRKAGRGPGPVIPLPAEIIEKRRAENPREQPSSDVDTEYS